MAKQLRGVKTPSNTDSKDALPEQANQGDERAAEEAAQVEKDYRLMKSSTGRTNFAADVDSAAFVQEK